MTDTTRKRLTLLAALLPGAGQLAGGRLLRGLVCGVAATAAVAALLLDAFVLVPFLCPVGRIVFVCIAAAAWVLGIVDTAVLARRRFDPSRGERRIATLRRGNLLVMQGRLAEARAAYMEAVGRDRSDISALLKVAVLDHLAGDGRTARIHLQECRHLDGADAWRYQIAAAIGWVSAGSPEMVTTEDSARPSAATTRG